MSAKIINFLKNWTLPVSMLTGALTYLIFSAIPSIDGFTSGADTVVTAIFPFVMMTILFATFCRVDFHAMRIRRWHLALIALQLALIALFILLVTCHSFSNFDFQFSIFPSWWDGSRALSLVTFYQAMLVCIVAPCAAAAPVVTGKLGGNVGSMTTYTMLSNTICACIIPISFTLLPYGSHAAGDGWSLFTHLARSTALVLLLPLLSAWLVRRHLPRIHRAVVSVRDLPFYLWALSLSIVSGLTVKHIIHARAPLPLLFVLAAGSLILCLLQFYLGRALGHRFAAPLEAGQGLGQKNTAFAIWLAVTHLTPLSSVAPGCYILWQNIINSLEIAAHRKKAGIN